MAAPIDRLPKGRLASLRSGRAHETIAALARPLALGLILLVATTLLFVEAFHAPAPHNVPVGIVGAPRQAVPVRDALDRAFPGGFSVGAFDDVADARRAVTHAQIFGALAPAGDGYRGLTAQAFGAPAADIVVAAFEALAANSRRSLAIVDLVPLPAHDRFGVSALFCAVAVLIPSLMFGGLLAFFGARQSLSLRAATLLVFVTLASLLAFLDVDVIVGALTRAFPILLVCSALAAGVALTTHGLARLLGLPGLGLAFLLFLVLGLPTSGGLIGHDFQPAFYGAVSQWLPLGAALVALRNATYFHWAATAQPLLALAAWTLVGAVLLGLDGSRRQARADGWLV
jgi:hypothetical protein